MRIGFLAYQGMTQLDLTGPFEALSKGPGVETLVIARSARPVTADGGLTLKPHKSFGQSGRLDMLIVPGGPGVNKVINDKQTIDYVRRISIDAKYMASVCTGSLVLGAAGLLKGKTAATHWTARKFLEEFGAKPSIARVVKDGNIITGGGVTAGIDFGLNVAAELAGEEVAKKIQLALEYDPAPPFDSGSPLKASKKTVRDVQDSIVSRQLERRAAVMKAARKLSLEERWDDQPVA